MAFAHWADSYPQKAEPKYPMAFAQWVDSYPQKEESEYPHWVESYPQRAEWWLYDKSRKEEL